MNRVKENKNKKITITSRIFELPLGDFAIEILLDETR